MYYISQTVEIMSFSLTRMKGQCSSCTVQQVLFRWFLVIYIYVCVISPSLSFIVMMPLQRLQGNLRGDEVVENGVLSGSLSPAQVVDKGGDEQGDE